MLVKILKKAFKKETKIDKLARRKKNLVLERDKALRDMRNRNSKRETKIAVLENQSLTDYENTNKRVIELNRQIDKAIRDIQSEQIYVNEVADGEKKEDLAEKSKREREKLA